MSRERRGLALDGIFEAMRSPLVMWIFGMVVGCAGDARRGTAVDTATLPSTQPSRMRIVYDLDLDIAIDDRARVIRQTLVPDPKIADVRVSDTSVGTLSLVLRDAADHAAIAQLVKKTQSDTLESYLRS